jgi:hypothetical protein
MYVVSWLYRMLSDIFRLLEYQPSDVSRAMLGPVRVVAGVIGLCVATGVLGPVCVVTSGL